MEPQDTKVKISKGKKRKFIFFTLIFLAVVIFFISEILLYAFHYDSTYDRMKGFTLEQANWWTSDSISGPRYVANQVGKADSEYFKDQMWYYNRLKIVNNEGYHDKDDFKEIPAGSDSLKILVDGDSFTWGASADVDSSYVDVFESDIKKAYPSLVWNTGIPATGTNHALFTTKKFLPLQKSNYVVLGFYVGNDFGDNLLPFDQLIFNKQAACYNLYDYDKDFKPYKISKREAYKKITGSYPMEELNFLQKIIIRSRLITFCKEMTGKVINRLSGNKRRSTEQQYKKTSDYLKQLNDYVKQNNAELIVYVIPTAEDTEKKEQQYLDVVKILKEQSINYFENTALFTKSDYLKIGGGHWKNSGHITAGHALSKYLLDLIAEKHKDKFKKY